MQIDHNGSGNIDSIMDFQLTAIDVKGSAQSTEKEKKATAKSDPVDCSRVMQQYFKMLKRHNFRFLCMPMAAGPLTVASCQLPVRLPWHLNHSDQEMAAVSVEQELEAG